MASNKKDQDIPLGKKVEYSNCYDPNLLFKIARPLRTESYLKFGFDRWVCYEFTYLNRSGCPQCCLLEIIVPASSGFIVESKSLKLYLGSFYQENFEDRPAVIKVIESDLRSTLECQDIQVKAIETSDIACLQISRLPGISVDKNPTSFSQFDSPSKELLEAGSEIVSETLYSELFRSLCPVTSQPDYATIIIDYQGPSIIRPSLLRYIVAYRNHSGFHETCCESIFEDISTVCKPEKLVVSCFFNRRGGIDINPTRSNHVEQRAWFSSRCSRQ